MAPQVQRAIHEVVPRSVHLLRANYGPLARPSFVGIRGPPTSPLFVRAGTLTAYARSSPLFGDPRPRAVINSPRCRYFFALFFPTPPSLRTPSRTRSHAGPPYSTDSFSSPYIPSPRLTHCAAPPLNGTFVRPRDSRGYIDVRKVFQGTSTPNRTRRAISISFRKRRLPRGISPPVVAFDFSLENSLIDCLCFRFSF